MLRKILFWAHLVTGGVAGIVILMMSVTGVILTFEMQLNRWALSGYRAEPTEALPLDVDTLLGRVADADPELAPSSVTFVADPLEPVALGLGRGSYLYADRYTGEILGDGNGKMKRFMRSVMYWHRWFALSGDERAIGRAITGAANLGFLFLVMSGFYLWWPRSLRPAALRKITWFRYGLSGKARDFNWHNVIGFWTAVPLVIIVLSGVVISYRWAGDLVYTVTGTEAPVRSDRTAAEEAPPTSIDPSMAPVPMSLDELFAHAASEVPGWRSLTLRLPKSELEPVVFSIDTSPGRQPSKRTELTIDRSTCDVIDRTGFDDYNRGRQLRSWLRFAHTGEVYGPVGQTIAGVASAGAAVLVWTGISLAWRRFFPRR